MNSSGHSTRELPPLAATPYPSAPSGNWPMFMVGLALIALFLSALAFSPRGDDAVPGLAARPELVSRPALAAEAVALQERNTPLVDGANAYRVTQPAEDL